MHNLNARRPQLSIRVAMFVTFTAIFVAFGMTSVLQAQADLWLNYSNPGARTSVLIDGNELWGGSAAAGLARLNMSAESVEIFNRGNSGMRSNGVRTLVREESGIVWAGTFDGVTKFDGQNFVHFHTLNSEIGITTVHDICLDKNGSVWVAGLEGVAVYENGEWEHFNQNNSGMPFSHTRNLVLTPEGNILASVNSPQDNASFALFTDGVWANFQINGFTETSFFTVTDMLYDANGNLWLATISRGLLNWNGSSLRAFDSFNSPFPNTGGINVQTIEDLHLGRDGSIIVAASGIYTYHSDMSWSVYRIANSDLFSENINQVIEDEESGLWYLASNDGIFSFDSNTSQVFEVFPQQVPSNNITGLSATNDGVWMSSFGGVGLAAPQGLGNWTMENSTLRANFILAVAAAENGPAYCATFGLGVYRYDKGEWAELGGIGTDFDARFVRALAVDGSQDILWVATDLGLLRRDGAEVTRFTQNGEGNYPYTTTMDVTILPNGDVWTCGLTSGVAVLRDGNWQHFTTENSAIPSNSVAGVHADVDDMVWLRFNDNNGIARMTRDGQIDIFTTQNSGLPLDNVGDIAVGQTGTVWIAYQGGVCAFDGIDWTNYTSTNSPISGNVFTSIVVDQSNNVWVGSTNFGINFFGNPQTVDVAEDRQRSDRLPLTASIAPNPAANFATVRFDALASDRVELALVDQRGAVVDAPIVQIASEGDIRTCRVNLDGLMQGWYALRITTNDRSIALPLVVNR